MPPGVGEGLRPERGGQSEAEPREGGHFVVQLARRLAAINQLFGVTEVIRPHAGTREIQPDGGFWKQPFEERGFACLPSAENDVDVGRRKLPGPDGFNPTTKHIVRFVSARLF